MTDRQAPPAVLQLWALALRLINFTGAGRQEPEVVRTYWDWHLLEACLLRRGDAASAAQLQEACTRTLSVAADFYPNEDRWGPARCQLWRRQPYFSCLDGL